MVRGENVIFWLEGRTAVAETRKGGWTAVAGSLASVVGTVSIGADDVKRVSGIWTGKGLIAE
jgi:hypothetical protein